jgi:hypothetical protein
MLREEDENKNNNKGKRNENETSKREWVATIATAIWAAVIVGIVCKVYYL